MPKETWNELLEQVRGAFSELLLAAELNITRANLYYGRLCRDVLLRQEKLIKEMFPFVYGKRLSSPEVSLKFF